MALDYLPVHLVNAVFDIGFQLFISKMLGSSSSAQISLHKFEEFSQLLPFSHLPPAHLALSNMPICSTQLGRRHRTPVISLYLFDRKVLQKNRSKFLFLFYPEPCRYKIKARKTSKYYHIKKS